MQYLNFFPFNRMKRIKSLIDHVILLAEKKFYHNNLKTVHYLLLMNNYPPQFITKHINKRILEIRSRNNNKHDINKITELGKCIISILYYVLTGRMSYKYNGFPALAASVI